jgi:hypothetical protein
VTRKKRPKLTKRQTLDALKNAVSVDRYVRYSDPNDLPDGVPWSGPDCMAVELGAASYAGGQIAGLGPSPAPGTMVLQWRAWRADPEGPPHWNEYDALYYEDVDGRAWRINSQDSPHHVKEITSGSALEALLRDYGLSAASCGALHESSHDGANLHFESLFTDSE